MTLTDASRTLPVNGVDLAWSEQGSGGTTLVLCHGFTGSSHDFALEVDTLATKRRVVTLDQRGHGHSTKTGTLDGYTIEQLSSDLAGFLDTVGGGVPVDLLGHSMGGRVVATMVLQRPELVRSLILMDTSAWSFVPDDEGVRELVRAFFDGFDPSAGMPERWNLGGPEDDLIATVVPASWQQEKDVIQAGTDPYAVKALGGEILAHDEAPGSLRPRLGSIDCPTTVIAGEHDHPMVDQAPALAAEVANGRTTVIAGAYHSPQLTHPDAWRAALESHLEWVDQ
jgi:pimeloyl-ACP methyl ester carboxylesterase